MRVYQTVAHYSQPFLSLQILIMAPKIIILNMSSSPYHVKVTLLCEILTWQVNELQGNKTMKASICLPLNEWVLWTINVFIIWMDPSKGSWFILYIRYNAHMMYHMDPQGVLSVIWNTIYTTESHSKAY